MINIEFVNWELRTGDDCTLSIGIHINKSVLVSNTAEENIIQDVIVLPVTDDDAPLFTYSIRGSVICHVKGQCPTVENVIRSNTGVSISLNTPKENIIAGVGSIDIIVENLDPFYVKRTMVTIPHKYIPLKTELAKTVDDIGLIATDTNDVGIYTTSDDIPYVGKICTGTPCDLTIVFGKLREDAVIPSKRDEDAGLDIYVIFDEDVKVIPPHETVLFNTGLVSYFSPEWYIMLNERSSTGSVGIAQRAAIIDSGYRGEWSVVVTNTTNRWIAIAKNPDDPHLMKNIKKTIIRDTYVFDTVGLDIENTIILPYNRALCQATIHRNYKPNIIVENADVVQSMPSERGTGSMGSSGK